jgi:hypothetical protein
MTGGNSGSKDTENETKGRVRNRFDSIAGGAFARSDTKHARQFLNGPKIKARIKFHSKTKELSPNRVTTIIID